MHNYTPLQFQNTMNIPEFQLERETSETTFAIYTNSSDGTRFYLSPHPLPVYNPQGDVVGSRKTILAVQNPQEKYVFHFSPTTYNGGVGGNQQAMPEGPEPRGLSRHNRKNCIIL